MAIYKSVRPVQLHRGQACGEVGEWLLSAAAFAGGLVVGGAQQARVLLCGRAGAGQDHLGPALLAALEALPVHAIGLPSLLSDANSR